MQTNLLRENESRGSASFFSVGLSRIYLLVLVPAVLLICASAFAQINLGRIVGRVTDPSGAVVPQATVTITNTGTNVAHTLTTDSSGAFVATALDPGTYTVSAQAAGFQVMTLQNVLVQVGNDTRADLTLQVGANTQTVTVTEAAPLVDTTSATVGGTLNNTAINDLPLNGRNFQHLPDLRPGTTIYPGGGPWQQSSNGQRPNATAYFVDGLMDMDYNIGWTVTNTGTPISDAGSVLPLDAIAEFNVQQNPDAQYGWLSGNVINVGIKTGTNSLHGSVYGFGRDGAWDARNYYNPAPQAIPAVNMENWGASLGGPIRKDKLFFFLAFEERRDELANFFGMSIPETTSQVSPSKPAGDPTNSIPDAEAALTAMGKAISPVSVKLLSLYPANATNSQSMNFGFPNTDLTDNGIAKITYAINQQNTLNGSLFRSQYLGVGEDHPYVNSLFLVHIPMSVWMNTDTWTWTPNSRWVNELTFGTNRLLQTRHADTVSPTVYGINTGVPPSAGEGGLPTINISGFNSLGTNAISPIGDGPDAVYDGLDTLSWVRGNHAIKFGFELSHISSDVCCTTDGRGVIPFGGGATFTGSTPLEDFLTGNASFPAIIGVGSGIRHLETWYYAGFIQDDWRVTPRLTLNLGLRYEYFAPPTEKDGLLGSFSPTAGLEQVGKQVGSFFKPSRDNFSPRVGVAWDPTGSGRSVIRAGGALIWDHPQLGAFTSSAQIPTGFQLCSPTCVQGPGTINNGTINTVVGPSDWNGVVFGSSLGGTPSCTTTHRCSITFTDPNLRFPYIAKWNFGIQHSFTRTLGLDVNYVGNHGVDLWSTNDLNAPLDPLSGNTKGPLFPLFPYLNHVTENVSRGVSNYNGLQVQLQQNTFHGLSFLAGYTYSHALNDVAKPADGHTLSLMEGNADFDIRHRFTLSTTYALPSRKSPLQLLEGWELNSIVTIQTGLPWGVVSAGPVGLPNGDISETGELVDPWDFSGNPSDFTSASVAIPYCSGTFETPGAVTCVSYPFDAPAQPMSLAQDAAYQTACNAAAPAGSKATPANPGSGTLDAFGCYAKGKSVMVPPPLGTIGTMERNMFRDFGFHNWDLSLFKNFRFGERVTAQFRAEFYNVFNHPEFANPYGAAAATGNNDPGAPSVFGCGCATPDVAAGSPVIGSGDSRAMQLGFELKF